MYVELLENQKEIINSTIKKAGSYRKLAKKLKIPRASIVRYKQEGAIPKDRFQKIIRFLGIEESSIEIKELQDNWKQVLGGKACVKSKKEKGIFDEQLKNAQKLGTEGIKKWHKKMKEENPKEYHLKQYEKFKKIRGYKFLTLKGERVRNKLEKDVADTLNKLGLDYKYEVLIKSEDRWFFPDFMIGEKIIIECTAWEGETKAYQLLEKIEYYKENYKVFVVIPKHLYMKYKILDEYLILGLDELARVAQLVRAIGC